MEHEGVMNGTIYEAAVWHEIERNKKHLKKDGDHYVADAMLFGENANLRQENESLKRENTKLSELVSCLLTCASHDCDCERCPINGGSGIWQPESFCDELLDLMRELGIEVKE